jgi:hypothetical protein
MSEAGSRTFATRATLVHSLRAERTESYTIPSPLAFSEPRPNSAAINSSPYPFAFSNCFSNFFTFGAIT